MTNLKQLATAPLHNPKRPPEERFWVRVKKTNECWVWTGWRNEDGYGVFRIKNIPVLVHRFSYELHNKPIPKGLVVRHTCDNPPCVNPKHLLVGTNVDNIRDAIERGRWSGGKGERHAFSKVTNEDVAYIRKHYRPGINQNQRGNGVELAKKFGISQASIWKIANRTAWKHI